MILIQNQKSKELDPDPDQKHCFPLCSILNLVSRNWHGLKANSLSKETGTYTESRRTGSGSDQNIRIQIRSTAFLSVQY